MKSTGPRPAHIEIAAIGLRKAIPIQSNPSKKKKNPNSQIATFKKMEETAHKVKKLISSFRCGRISPSWNACNLIR
jgi:hypothetical protein